jgi:uncharacterized protein (TIGR03067 family)
MGKSIWLASRERKRPEDQTGQALLFSGRLRSRLANCYPALNHAAIALYPLPAARADDILKSLQNLQGSWKLVALNVDGKEITPPPSNIKVKIKGDSFSYQSGGEGKATLKADTEPKVPTLDIAYTEGKRKGTTIAAVFEVKGDTLRLCMASDLKTRPEAVAAKKGVIVETSKMVK